METKITKGEWVAGKPNTDEWQILSNENGHFTFICMTPTKYEDSEANAKLIADAGNTTNKCGLLPSELLEKRNEWFGIAVQLLEALVLILPVAEEWITKDHPIHIKAVNAIKKAIE